MVASMAEPPNGRVVRRLEALRKAAQEATAATDRRNDLIRMLRYEDAVPLRTIAEAAGLSHTAISKVAPTRPRRRR